MDPGIDNSGSGCQELPRGHSLISFHTSTDRQVSPYECHHPFFILGISWGKVEGSFGAENLIEMLQVFST